MFDYQLDSSSILIQNDGPAADFRLKIPFSEYGSQPFFIRDSIISIPENGSRVVWVFCQPIHNVLNKAQLLVLGQSQATTSDPVSVSLPLSVSCRYKKSYYSISENLSEEALKQALKTRISLNYNSLGYNVARDNMYGSLDNVNDSVTCIYTNKKAKFNTRAGATANNFNCEHTFPQGFFGQDEPMRSDIHHLFSTNEDANNSRGNLPFGVAVPPLIQEAINFPSKNGGGKYEPQDSHKGNCARAMMYFVLRYQDYTNFYAPQNTILRQWHRMFPPGPKDTARNFGIFQLQSNRNPFVDYPQLADRISSLTSNSVSDSTPKLGLSHNEMVFSGQTPAGANQYHSFLVYNSGNQKLNIKVRISGALSNLSFPSDSAFVLAKNAAKTIWLQKGCGPVADTITFLSNDPVKQRVKVAMSCLLSSVSGVYHFGEVELIPNPAHGFFQISGLTPGKEYRLLIFNILGQKLAQFSGISSIQNSVKLPPLPSGVYQVVLQSENQIISRKLNIH